MVPGGVPFPLIADASGLIGQAYGVFEPAAGVDIRGRFIIDPDFNIRAMEVLTPEVGRSVSELIRQIKAFQHVRATGEVMPAGKSYDDCPWAVPTKAGPWVGWFQPATFMAVGILAALHWRGITG